jgi:hypothetical protein
MTNCANFTVTKKEEGEKAMVRRFNAVASRGQTWGEFNAAQQHTPRTILLFFLSLMFVEVQKCDRLTRHFERH